MKKYHSEDRQGAVNKRYACLLLEYIVCCSVLTLCRQYLDTLTNA